jgi:hypothetical protein
MAALRTLPEVYAAGAALAASWPPPSQAVVNAAAAILAPCQPETARAA